MGIRTPTPTITLRSLKSYPSSPGYFPSENSSWHSPRTIPLNISFKCQLSTFTACLLCHITHTSECCLCITWNKALSAVSWTFQPALSREHSAVTATELLQPLHIACGTLFRSSCAASRWAKTYGLFTRQLKGHLLRKACTRRSVTSDMRRLGKTLTYLLTYLL